MLDLPKPNESLKAWAKRNGIELGDERPEMIGYWCRVSGVSLFDEGMRRKYGTTKQGVARNGWLRAEEEIEEEIETGVRSA